MTLRYVARLALIASLLPITASAALSDKRGIGIAQPSASDVELLSNNVAWYYNWKVAPDGWLAVDKVANAPEFVPMVWGGNFNEKRLRQYLSHHPKVKYLLAFNEPNFRHQANLTPKQAAKLWPKIETIADQYHLKIVAPAVNYSPGDVDIPGTKQDSSPFAYLDSFFAECPHCRVDYLAVHSYMSTPEAVKRYVSKFYQRYQKPIWLTEWNLNLGKRKETQSQQMDFMAETVRWLEEQPFVFRYAWFVARSGKVAQPRQADLLTGNHWNPLGKLYTQLPNTHTLYKMPFTINAFQAQRLRGFHHQVDNSSATILLNGERGATTEFAFTSDISHSASVALNYKSQDKTNVEYKMDDETWQLAVLPKATLPTWFNLSTHKAISPGEHTLTLRIQEQNLRIAKLRIQ